MLYCPATDWVRPAAATTCNNHRYCKDGVGLPRGTSPVQQNGEILSFAPAEESELAYSFRRHFSQKGQQEAAVWEARVLSPQAEQSQVPVWERTGQSTGSYDNNRVEEQTEKVGVLLLNLGGPETLDDVQPFLYNLFNDDSIIRLPPQSIPLSKAQSIVHQMHIKVFPCIAISCTLVKREQALLLAQILKAKGVVTLSGCECFIAVGECSDRRPGP